MFFQSPSIYEQFPKLVGLIPHYTFTLIAIGIWIYFGGSFISKARNETENPAQKSFYRGFGLFVTFSAICAGVVTIDYMSRVFTGRRIFWTDGDWQAFLGVPELTLLLNRDYWIFILIFVLFALSFLLRPVERYMLGHQSTPLSTTCLFFSPIVLVVRMFELNAYAWFGIVLKKESLFTFIFFTINGFIILITLIAFFVLVTLYVRMARSAPGGSVLRKKSVEVVVGLFIWLVGIFTANIHTEIVEILFSSLHPFNIFEWYFVFAPGIYLFIALGLISAGMRREYSF